MEIWRQATPTYRPKLSWGDTASPSIGDGTDTTRKLRPERAPAAEAQWWRHRRILGGRYRRQPFARRRRAAGSRPEAIWRIRISNRATMMARLRCDLGSQ